MSAADTSLATFHAAATPGDASPDEPTITDSRLGYTGESRCLARRNERRVKTAICPICEQPREAWDETTFGPHLERPDHTFEALVRAADRRRHARRQRRHADRSTPATRQTTLDEWGVTTSPVTGLEVWGVPDREQASLDAWTPDATATAPPTAAAEPGDAPERTTGVGSDDSVRATPHPDNAGKRLVADGGLDVSTQVPDDREPPADRPPGYERLRDAVKRAERLFVLVGCGAAKRDDGSHTARDLYTSTYFALKREFAETFATRWVILSAEHHVLHPVGVVEPYDTALSEFSQQELTEWAINCAPRLTPLVRADDVTTVLLAGQDYGRALDMAETEASDTVRPFEPTTGIGEQMALVRRVIDDYRDGPEGFNTDT
jgi:hypothetical protein